jgi:hypothetical protein
MAMMAQQGKSSVIFAQQRITIAISSSRRVDLENARA